MEVLGPFTTIAFNSIGNDDFGKNGISAKIWYPASLHKKGLLQGLKMDETFSKVGVKQSEPNKNQTWQADQRQ